MWVKRSRKNLGDGMHTVRREWALLGVGGADESRIHKGELVVPHPTARPPVSAEATLPDQRVDGKCRPAIDPRSAFVVHPSIKILVKEGKA